MPGTTERCNEIGLPIYITQTGDVALWHMVQSYAS